MCLIAFEGASLPFVSSLIARALTFVAQVVRTR